MKKRFIIFILLIILLKVNYCFEIKYLNEIYLFKDKDLINDNFFLNYDSKLFYFNNINDIYSIDIKTNKISNIVKNDKKPINDKSTIIFY